ncbi:hypothetical protein [Cereibacter changlensis]|nr:hypothetical protein [Cereibacter changlensis]PZX49998.1 hypothetical protein LX76_03605 [Cereibacter changlensis]
MARGGPVMIGAGMPKAQHGAAPRKTIRVSDFRQSAVTGAPRLSCLLEGEGLPERLWFDIQSGAVGPLALTEPNWAAIALIYPAMLTGRDLRIEASLSPRLLSALRGDLQDLLLAYDPRLRRIGIHAQAGILPPELQTTGGAASGFSGGVDSFATWLLYTRPDVPAALRLTHVSLHNVGAFGPRAGAQAAFAASARRHAEFAAGQGLAALQVDSNLDDLFRPIDPNFDHSHSLRNVAVAHIFADSLQYYLCSSAYPYDQIGIAGLRAAKALSTAYLDPLLLPLLSTERLTVISAGAGLTRQDKIALLADDPLAQRQLDVCTSSPAERARAGRLNCSDCKKCQRTIVTLDALGKLDRFAAVFDVEGYRARRRKVLSRIHRKALSGSTTDRAVMVVLRREGVRVPELWPRVAALAVRGLTLLRLRR